MYLLDANVLITAKNSYYGFDICPGFWDWLASAFSANQVASIDAVYEEILKGEDKLTEWAKDNKQYFLSSTVEAAQKVGELTTWALNKNFTQEAVNTFAESADIQLVAFAAAHDHLVVTHETYNAETRKRVKIPNACRYVSVSYTDPFAMMRKHQVQLVSLPSP